MEKLLTLAELSTKDGDDENNSMNTTKSGDEGLYFRLTWKTLYQIYKIWVPKSRAVKIN